MTDPINMLSKLVNRPDSWDFAGAEQLYAGVDLGTYKTIAIIIDENGTPRAASMRRTEIARSGMIVDYVGALNTVRELLEEIRKHSPFVIHTQTIAKKATRMMIRIRCRRPNLATNPPCPSYCR